MATGSDAISQAMKGDGGREGHHGTIPLERMTQQIEVRKQDDDWTGITDPVERRKLQNRLHQRLWRKRQASSKIRNKTKSKSSKEEIRALTAYKPVEEQQAVQVIDKVASSVPAVKTLAARPPISICNVSPTSMQEMVERFERWYRYRINVSPSADHLLHLVQFNVFRALLNNTSALGFTVIEFLKEDGISPFNTMMLDTDVLGRNYPASLRPTAIQHAVKHHPWIDLFPMPAFRDNLLLADGAYDEDQLCADLVDFCKVPGEVGGLLVWGEPSNQFSWEVSEQFVEKWSWALKGCHELLASTNYWRLKRGDGRLSFVV